MLYSSPPPSQHPPWIPSGNASANASYHVLGARVQSNNSEAPYHDHHDDLEDSAEDDFGDVDDVEDVVAAAVQRE